MQTASLAAFNQHVLLLQDQAYSLAFCLLADETSAARVTQSAFENAYAQFDGNCQSLKLRVLRSILTSCSRLPNSRSLLPALPLRDRCVLLLVDALDLTYEEAARVLRCSPTQLARRLALARSRAANCDRILKRYSNDQDPHFGGG